MSGGKKWKDRGEVGLDENIEYEGIGGGGLCNVGRNA